MTHPNARQIQVRSSTRAVRGKSAGVQPQGCSRSGAGGFNIEKLIGRTFRPKLVIPYAHSPRKCTFS